MPALSFPNPARIVLAFALSLLWLGGLRAQDKPSPDVLVFTNGDQLTGKLERAVGPTVVFKSDILGELTFPIEKVKEIRSGTQFVGLTKDLKKHDAVGLVHIEGPSVVITRVPDGMVEATIPSKTLGYLIDKPAFDKEVAHKAGPLTGWNGSATAGVTIVRSTDNSTTVTGGMNLVRAIPTVPYFPKRNRTSFDLTESYGKLTTPVIPPTGASASIAKTNIFHADTERDEYVSARFYVLAEASFDHNYSQGLQLQQVYGFGTGWTPVQTAKQQLDLKGDVHYEKESFQVAGSNLNLFGSTFSENYRRTLPRKLVFTETATYLPAWNQLYAYSANVTGALAMPVFKRLSASVSMTDNYLNNPAPYYLKNSYQFVTGLTYTLH